jgi:hypothetical protein
MTQNDFGMLLGLIILLAPLVVGAIGLMQAAVSPRRPK